MLLTEITCEICKQTAPYENVRLGGKWLVTVEQTMAEAQRKAVEELEQAWEGLKDRLTATPTKTLQQIPQATLQPPQAAEAPKAVKRTLSMANADDVPIIQAICNRLTKGTATMEQVLEHYEIAPDAEPVFKLATML